MRVVIFGSRFLDEKNLDLVEQAVIASGYDITEVISGGASGGDKLGELWGEKHGIPIDKNPANWDDVTAKGAVVKYNKQGKAYNVLAGYWRNEDMAKKADAGIWLRHKDTNGSKHMYSQLKKLNKNIFLYPNGD